MGQKTIEMMKEIEEAVRLGLDSPKMDRTEKRLAAMFITMFITEHHGGDFLKVAKGVLKGVAPDDESKQAIKAFEESNATLDDVREYSKYNKQKFAGCYRTYWRELNG